MVTSVFTMLNRASLAEFHNRTKFGAIPMPTRKWPHPDDSGPYDRLDERNRPCRLQAGDPFAKGAHLPRGEPAFGSLFDDAVVAELVDAQR